MKLKVCFNNETHKISKTPDTYESLAQLISKVFIHKLPENWILEYVDSEEDKIRIRNEQDYKEFVELESKKYNSGSVAKVFVVPRQSLEETQIIESNNVSKSQLKEEEYRIVESSGNGTEDVKADEASKIEVEEPLTTEVAQEQKPAEQVQEAVETPEEKIVLENQINQKIDQEQKIEEIQIPQNSNPLQTKEQKTGTKNVTASKKNIVTKPKKVRVTSVDMHEQILERLLNTAVEKNLAKIASMTQPYLNHPQKPQQTQKKGRTAVHHGVRCDGCKVAPIVGIRYKCSVLPDFDFCETCEKNKEHPYAFIAIKRAGQPYSHKPKAAHPWGIYDQVEVLPVAGPAPSVCIHNPQTERSRNSVSKLVQENVPGVSKEVTEKPKDQMRQANKEEIKVEKVQTKAENSSSQVSIEDETNQKFGVSSRFGVFEQNRDQNSKFSMPKNKEQTQKLEQSYERLNDFMNGTRFGQGFMDFIKMFKH